MKKGPVTQKGGHALMFEEGSGPGLIVWGPGGMTEGGVRPAFVSFGKQSVICTCAPLISRQGSWGWVQH